MAYQIVQADSYWECVESLRRDDAYKAHLVDTLAELHRQPFRNPRLSTHEIGSAGNGCKLFSSDVGGRASDRRIIWQVFNRTIVVLLYGTHKVHDRAKRMQVAFDPQRQLVQVDERAPDGGVEQPQREPRDRAGGLFMPWSDADLRDRGFSEPAVAHLRRLNTEDELLDAGPHLGDRDIERAIDLITATGPAPSDDEPAVPEAPHGVPTTDAPDAGPADDVAPGTAPPPAAPPEVTGADVELERLLNDERTGAAFTRVEPEFLADVLHRPIEDWMIFLHPDQRTAATRHYAGPARVRGAAGTGKTVVGLHRAAHLAARNRSLDAGRGDPTVADTAPVPPVLFTTYVSSLPPVFEELYRRMPGTRADEVEFINVDKLARRVCVEEGERPVVVPNKVTKAYQEAFKQCVVPGSPLHGRFTRPYLRDEITKMIKGRAIDSLDAYLQLARTGRRTSLGRLQRIQVWELMECWNAHMARHGTIDFSDVILRALAHARRHSAPGYSAVIVDEAQDLTLAGLQLLRALLNAPNAAEDRPDGLFILGDGAQRIYPGGFTLRQAGVEVRGRTAVLTENYRNTDEIIGAAMAVAGDHRIEDLGEVLDRGREAISTIRRGPRPMLIKIDGLDPQIDEIARRIGELVRAGDGFGPGDAAVLAPSNTIANRIGAGLRSRGLDVQALDGYDGRPNDRVKVGTYHRGKGLEFKAVFLPALGRFPLLPHGLGDDEATEARELAVSQLFVAMTRARDLLVVLHGSDLAEEVAAASDHFERADRRTPEP